MTQQPGDHKGKTLVLLGDSIVYGWGVLRRQRYANVLQVLLDVDPCLNAWHAIAEGVPGDTVVQGVERFAQDVAPHQPDAVLIAFGLNDGAQSRTMFDAQRERAFLARSSPRWRLWFRMRRLSRMGRHALGLDAPLPGSIIREPEPRIRAHIFQSALRTLIRETSSLGAKPILLGLLPRNDVLFADEQRVSYSNYARLIGEVARSTETSMIHLDPPPADLGAHQPDGVHLTPEGHQWLAERIHAQLEQVLP